MFTPNTKSTSKLSSSRKYLNRDVSILKCGVYQTRTAFENAPSSSNRELLKLNLAGFIRIISIMLIACFFIGAISHVQAASHLYDEGDTSNHRLSATIDEFLNAGVDSPTPTHTPTPTATHTPTPTVIQLPSTAISIHLENEPKRWIAPGDEITYTIRFTNSAESVSILPPPTIPEFLPNVQEEALANLLVEAPEQRRTILNHNATLAAVARAHAQDMAARNYFGPVSPDGTGPNQRVTEAGYNLPSHYGTVLDSNNIESIAAGHGTAQDVWHTSLVNPGQSAHALGQNDFYAAQSEYGIGYTYAPSSEYKHYWVVLIAEPGEPVIDDNAASNIQIEATIPEHTEFVVGSANPAQAFLSHPGADGTIRWSFDDLNANSSGTIAYRIRRITPMDDTRVGDAGDGLTIEHDGVKATWDWQGQPMQATSKPIQNPQEIQPAPATTGTAQTPPASTPESAVTPTPSVPGPPEGDRIFLPFVSEE